MVTPSDNPAFAAQAPAPTGNMLVLMRPKIKSSTAARSLQNVSGAKVAVSREYTRRSGALRSALSDADCVYMENLNVAVLKPGDGARAAALTSSLAASSDVRMVRPEFYMYAFNSIEARYQAWVREGLRILADGGPGLSEGTGAATIGTREIMEDAASTWGIKAVKADQSPFTGRGIKLAVLDTGFDTGHPDYAGRNITTETFVPDQPVQDVQGHGTHCIGSAAGPGAGTGHPRYGVAVDADIFVGKVLGDDGSGAESWILAGMEWAIRNKCEVISMSLGRATRWGEDPDPLYEAVGQSALDNGSLIIAAAGNESFRQWWWIAPVGAPANSPSIMAVGAVDSNLQIASFSSGGINDNGGEVNIAGPGVDVLSSVPMPQRYRRLSGTSMATPHVAGIAALYAQSDASLRGQALWDVLRRTALDIGLPMRDAGAGLAQSPLGQGGNSGSPVA